MPNLDAASWATKAVADSARPLSRKPVEVPAAYAYANGVWYAVRRGVRGLVVRTRAGEPVVYLVCEPASHYYRVMTGSERMPVFIEQRI